MIKGVSVYSGLKDYSKENNLKYLEKIKNHQIDFIFTSMHISEASDKDREDFLKSLLSLNIPIVVDFSKKTYSYDIDNIIIPRLDYGFEIEDIKEMLKKHQLIELNASTVTEDYLISLKDHGLDLKRFRVSYNFYPKPYTGLSYESVEKSNSLFKKYGLTTIAYLPSTNQKRPPLYKGLTTIEDQRYQDLETNISELLAIGLDGCCVGDAYISDEEFDILDNTNNVVLNLDLMTTNLDEIEILKKVHQARIDESPYLIRSSSTRGIKLKANNTINLDKYMVVIDNENYLRYGGELSIIKQKIENDNNMNVVGTINQKSRKTVDLIKGRCHFTFKF